MNSLKESSPTYKRPRRNSPRHNSSSTLIQPSSSSTIPIWSPITDKTKLDSLSKKSSYLEFNSVYHESFTPTLDLVINLFFSALKDTTSSQLNKFITKMNSTNENKYDNSFFILYLSFHFFTFIVRYTGEKKAIHFNYVRLYKSYLTNVLNIDFSTRNQDFLKLITGKNFLYFTSSFTFDENDLENLFTKFSNFIKTSSEYISCDEKLYKTTRKTQNQIYCPKKPAKKGLWYFEACGKIAQGLSFLIHTSLRYCSDDVINTTKKMITPWIQLQKRMVNLKGTKPILVIDSFYSSKDSINSLVSEKVLFIMAIRKNIINAITNKKLKISSFIKDEINNAPGKSYKSSSNNLILSSGTLDVNNRKKDYYTLTNAFKISNSVKSKQKVSDIKNTYKEHFNSCDSFNAKLSSIQRHFKRRMKAVNREIPTHTAYLLDSLGINLYTYTIYIKNHQIKDYTIGKFYQDIMLELFNFAEYSFLKARGRETINDRHLKKLYKDYVQVKPKK